ncbi:MAG: hypothetical protein ACRECH_14380 [Nitrososphaerales archaeon]
MSEKQSWRSVELPEEIVAEAEELMRIKHEGRLTKAPLGLFMADLMRASIEREEATKKYQPPLEDYSIEPDCVYIRDNKRDVIAELRFKDGGDLYCNIDGAKNCVHIGFAWSIPKVNLLIAAQKPQTREK